MQQQELSLSNAKLGGRVFLRGNNIYGTIVYLDVYNVGINWETGQSGLWSFKGGGDLYFRMGTIRCHDLFVVPPVSYVEEKHLQYGTRIVLKGKPGKLACIGSWFVVAKFDNGDDALFIRKDGKLWYRQSKDSTLPGEVAPVELEK